MAPFAELSRPQRLTLQNRFPGFQRTVLRRRHLRHVVRAKDLREALKKGNFEPDPDYVEGGDFLRSLGMTNQAEISRVLDIAMNPNSLFLSEKERRMSSANARRLSVKEDMLPVIHYLRGIGIEDAQIVKMISQVPRLLGYSPEERIRPLIEYLSGLGVSDPAKTIVKRPSLLGLDVTENIEKIVGYLQENGYEMDHIVELLETTI